MYRTPGKNESPGSGRRKFDVPGRLDDGIVTDVRYRDVPAPGQEPVRSRRTIRIAAGGAFVVAVALVDLWVLDGADEIFAAVLRFFGR